MHNNELTITINTNEVYNWLKTIHGLFVIFRIEMMINNEYKMISNFHTRNVFLSGFDLLNFKVNQIPS